jgi:hypothetical protein
LATNSKDLFFRELKDEYSAQFELNNALEAKSGQLIMVCGIVIPLLFGFSSFLIDRIDNNNAFVLYLQIVLVVILAIITSSIFFSVWTLKIQLYKHAFLPYAFYIDGKLNQAMIKKFGEKDVEETYYLMIEKYLEANKQNLKLNKKKARKIQLAQYLFLIGLAFIPILVAISFSMPLIRT